MWRARFLIPEMRRILRNAKARSGFSGASYLVQMEEEAELFLGLQFPQQPLLNLVSQAES